MKTLGGIQWKSGVSDKNIGISIENLGVSHKNIGISNENLADSYKNIGISNENPGGSDKNTGISNENLGVSDKNIGNFDEIRSLRWKCRVFSIKKAGGFWWDGSWNLRMYFNNDDFIRNF